MPIQPARLAITESDNFESADEFVGALVSLSRVMVAVATRTLARIDADVTLQQFRTLVVLVPGPQRVVDLANLLGVQSSTATRMCDRLVRKGLVARHERLADRRAAWVGLTVAGKELVGLGMRARQQELERMLADLRFGDAGQATAALGAVLRAAGELTDDAWWRQWADSVAD
ncbi:MarR family transcriptional regulator [Micromonospora sp. Llam7]|uniref:MarR family winged helix-turn-helix transcriptional regulator n=1 Tax=Micromonospora tarapacensis TaxID=2835305 RepID=UPI001C8358D6|nr:MarR family transcriptional regulator [Micromonospora tarapacensis]MBX7266830.1 MarR family transcriptional regulator [Micromonospora tarapacensis]